jgi:hypothetical protein
VVCCFQVYPKFKISTAEEGNFQKNLLLCIVRLIHADPMLMLNSQVESALRLKRL